MTANVPDQRPRASDVRSGTETQSRGSLHPVCSVDQILRPKPARILKRQRLKSYPIQGKRSGREAIRYLRPFPSYTSWNVISALSAPTFAGTLTTTLLWSGTGTFSLGRSPTSDAAGRRLRMTG